MQGGLPVVIVDGAKRIVEISKPPNRIVSLSPGTTEMLFAIGAGEQVIGATSWCNYPEQVLSLPKVGDMNVNFEIVAALLPDLIIGDASLQPATAERLESLGFPVFLIQALNITGILDSLELLGRVTGNLDIAQTLVIELVEDLRTYRKAIASSPLQAQPVTTLLLFGTDQLYSAGNGTYLDEVIRRAGGDNIAAGARGQWPQLSEEYILARDPEIILLTFGDPADFLNKSKWRQIKAVRNNNIFSLDPDQYNRPTPRLIKGIANIQNLFLQVRKEG